jgi:hypothetical protein
MARQVYFVSPILLLCHPLLRPNSPLSQETDVLRAYLNMTKSAVNKGR